jgi:hypothetical protein
MGQLAVFRAEIARSWHRVLNRRSQKANLTRARMDKLIDDWLPKPRILHPWPDKRFAVTHPRWEPWDSCMYGSERGARGNSRPYRTRREFITLLGGATQPPKAARELAERPLG